MVRQAGGRAGGQAGIFLKGNVGEQVGSENQQHCAAGTPSLGNGLDLCSPHGPIASCMCTADPSAGGHTCSSGVAVVTPAAIVAAGLHCPAVVIGAVRNTQSSIARGAKMVTAESVGRICLSLCWFVHPKCIGQQHISHYIHYLLDICC